MCETNNDDFQQRLRETLQTRELAAENDFRFSAPSQDQIDALYEAISNLVSALSEAINQVFSTISQAFGPLLKSIAEQEAALTWAAVYHPRLYHCAKYSKRLRIQVKNITRIVKLYRKQKEDAE